MNIVNYQAMSIENEFYDCTMTLVEESAYNFVFKTPCMNIIDRFIGKSGSINILHS